MQSKVVLKDKMAFEAYADGHSFMVDAAEAVGGQNLGPMPKTLALTSVAGCTAMDVISVLRKMRSEPTGFEVEVDGPLADEHPKKFTAIKIRYLFTGDALDPEKVKKAVSLSVERYCGVIASLRPGAPIETEILINGSPL